MWQLQEGLFRCLGKESGNISALISSSIWGTDGYTCITYPTGLPGPAGWGQWKLPPASKPRSSSRAQSVLDWGRCQLQKIRDNVAGQSGHLHSAPLLTVCGQLDPQEKYMGDRKFVQRKNLSQYLYLLGATLPLLSPPQPFRLCSSLLPNHPDSDSVFYHLQVS